MKWNISFSNIRRNVLSCKFSFATLAMIDEKCQLDVKFSLMTCKNLYSPQMVEMTNNKQKCVPG